MFTKSILFLAIGTICTFSLPNARAADEFDTRIEGEVTELNQVNSARPNTNCADASLTKDPGTCDLLHARNDGFNFLPEKWNFEAFGFDLLRKQPAVLQASPNGTLSFVDTGEKVKGNPAAGAALQANSPEVDNGEHGTHVIGSAASSEFGVNPKISVKMFPAKSNPGGYGFDEADLFNQLDAAASDPKTDILSVSITFSEDPKNMAIIKKAIANHKWVVYAAGNSGEVNDAGANGQVAFRNRADFFAVGSLNYFGSPSFFSNFGERIRFYSPGSQITSLNKNYNASISATKPNLDMSGTSMATPIFAAVLQTLRDIDHQLTAEQANSILALTAIHRGTAPVISQINPLLAAELLSKSKTCLHAVGADANGCLKSKIQEIQQANILPPAPSTNNCQDQTAYYEALRRAYFLSQGAQSFSDKIEAFLTTNKAGPWAAKVYFAPAGQELAAVKAFPKDGLHTWARSEFEAADNFFSGKLSEDANLSKKASAKGLTGIYLLPATPENFEKYWQQCKADLVKLEPRRSNDCQSYIYSAPNEFKQLVATRLAKEPLLMEPDFLGPHSTLNEVDPATRSKLLALIIKGYESKPTAIGLNHLRDLIPELDSQTRKKIIQDFFATMKSGTFDTSGFPMIMPGFGAYTIEDLKTDMLWFAPQTVLDIEDPTNKEKILTLYKKNESNETVRQWRYGAHRLNDAGEAEEFKKDLAAPWPSDVLLDRDPDILKALGSDAIRPELLQILRQPNGLAKFCDSYPFRHCAFNSALTHTLLVSANVSDPALAKKLFQWLLSPAKPGEYQRGENLSIQALEGYENIPVVADYLHSIKSKPQTDPVAKRLRTEFLYAQLGNPSNSQFSDAVRELPANVQSDYSQFGLDVIQASPKMKKKFIKDISTFHASPKPKDCSGPVTGGNGLQQLVDSTIENSSAKQSALANLYPSFAPNMNAIIRQSDGCSIGDTSGAQFMGNNFALALGNQASAVKNIMQAAYSVYQSGRQDRCGCGHEAPIALLFAMTKTKIGEQILANNPEWQKAIVSDLTNPAKNFNETINYIPKPLYPLLEKQMPKAEDLVNYLNKQDDHKIPNWIITLISTDTNSFAYALQLARAEEKLHKSGDDYVYYSVLNQIKTLFRANPEFGFSHLRDLDEFTIQDTFRRPIRISDDIEKSIQ